MYFDAIQELWEETLASSRRHGEQIENALAQSKAAQYLHVASWERSRSVHHLQPEKTRPPERLTEQELRDTREKLGPLLSIADEGLDWLYQSVGDSGCCVLLADKNGVPVARRGASGDDAVFQDCGLWTGAIWSEASEGTNGIGTSIVEERPLTIYKDQHYHSKNTGLSCTAAPVFDDQGELIAVIDVSSGRSDLTLGTVKLISIAVKDVARRIESRYFRNSFPDARMVMATSNHNHSTFQDEPQAAAIFAVDEDDLVIGATHAARRMFQLTDADFDNPIPLSAISGEQVNDAQEYLNAESRVLRQALARNVGNISATAKALGISRATLHRKLKRLGI